MRCGKCNEPCGNLDDLETHYRKRHWREWIAMKKRSAKEAREKHGNLAEGRFEEGET